MWSKIYIFIGIHTKYWKTIYVFLRFTFWVKTKLHTKKKQQQQKTKKSQEVKLKVAARYEKKKNKLFRIGKISVKWHFPDGKKRTKNTSLFKSIVRSSNT